MSFPSANVIMPTQNPAGLCAAYCQTWLMLSLLGGRPCTNPQLIKNPGQMGGIQAVAGKASVTALANNGMQVWEKEELKGNTRWEDAFDHLLEASPGYYYITFENPQHAMACFYKAPAIFFLEAGCGLMHFHNNTKFGEEAAAFYAASSKSPTADHFRYYKVRLSNAAEGDEKPVNYTRPPRQPWTPAKPTKP